MIAIITYFVQLNAMKGKEDYAKKLEEILISPSGGNQEDTLPEMDYSKSVKRFSKVCYIK